MPHTPRRHVPSSFSAGRRGLRLETLEDRRLLAVTVDTPLDVIDSGDGLTSLREAVVAVNTTPEDTIDFAAALSGETISLSLGQLVASQPLTIDASGLSDRVTIDAQQNSRVVNFTSISGDLTLAGLAVTGGRTTDDNADGGGIRFDSSGTLTLVDSEITCNETTGEFADGGGVYSTTGPVALLRSTISNNTSGDEGGGIYSSSGAITINNSTLSGNDSADEGGGIASVGASITIRNSTVSGNRSTSAGGGGIFTVSGAVTISDSTVFGNTATGVGGGLLVADPAAGGNQPLTIINSIVAENTSASAPDLRPDPGSALAVTFSLIGDGVAGLTAAQQAAISGGAGNLLSIDPLLDSLADNGGPTLTHAPLAGSPVLSAGSANSLADQRGLPRALGAGPEIGAVEILGTTPTLPGDYNRNNVVDAADYTVWRDNFGTTGLLAHAGADGDGDGVITRDDYDLWIEEFGQTFTPGSPTAGTASVFAPTATTLRSAENAADAALAQQAIVEILQAGPSVTSTTEARLLREPIRTNALLLFLADRVVTQDEEEGPTLLNDPPREETPIPESGDASLGLEA